MKWIGLTGGIGTGKTTVSGIIQTLGYQVLDADKKAHEALEKKSPVFSNVVKTFGNQILNTSGEIDRKKLSDIVFSDKVLLAKLEAITHPFINAEIQKMRDKIAASGADMAFYDIPLLFEKKLEKKFDKIVVVACKKDLQLERAMQRTSLSMDEVKKRISNQIPLEVKIKGANYTVRNDGSIEELQMKVQDIILQIKKDLKLV